MSAATNSLSPSYFQLLSPHNGPRSCQRTSMPKEPEGARATLAISKTSISSIFFHTINRSFNCAQSIRYTYTTLKQYVGFRFLFGHLCVLRWTTVGWQVTRRLHELAVSSTARPYQIYGALVNHETITYTPSAFIHMNSGSFFVSGCPIWSRRGAHKNFGTSHLTLRRISWQTRSVVIVFFWGVPECI